MNNMFESTVELLEELEEKINTLNDYDKIELLIDIITSLKFNDIEKAKNEIKKDDGFYNPELKKLESNIYYFDKITDILCDKIY